MCNIDWNMVQQILIDKLPWLLSMIIAIVIYEGLKKGTKVLVHKVMEHKTKTGIYIGVAASVALVAYFIARWMGYL